MTFELFTDAIRYVHLVAVAVGLGTAFVADLTALRHMGSGITPRVLDTLHTCHRIIWPALAVMWLSGLVLIGIRTGYVIADFSPKLWTKIAVVTLLTFNAFAIGRIAMPALTENDGRGLAALPVKTLFSAAMISGVSTASWLLALALGSSKVLAASPAEVFFVLLPLAYGCALLGGLGAVTLLRSRAGPVPA